MAFIYVVAIYVYYERAINTFGLRSISVYVFTMLRLILLSVMLVVTIVYSEGDQRIIHVNELVSDDENVFTNGEDDNSHICCIYGNCTCNSLDHALANLTSNVLINITTNVTLSLLIKALGLYNVSVIGHNNPTVNCKNAGEIHLTHCHNSIIQSITWDRCGTEITKDHK